MSLPEYEVLALRYGWRPAMRADLFIGGDPHDAPATMDYFLWVIRGEGRLFVVDTGFNQDMAAKRGRTLLRTPVEALKLAGVDPLAVEQIIITHFHNDHVGAVDSFPNAVFHVQDDEMAFATGRYMRYERFGKPYEPDHVCGLVRLVFANRVVFHDGDEEIAPGLSVHRIGGHTMGLQVVRVHTRRGWVVLASDASHYYEHFETGRGFPLVFHVGELIEGYGKLKKLASSPRHVVPGHDPLVMERYPAASAALQGIAVRLDAEPNA
ncbi:MAG: N-acyl homoserine lactonase family protein [Betaproteobacteria bacterium]|nr:N-acyl homoserine lactonase family protein [Betaproteobacteria bacterium]